MINKAILVGRLGKDPEIRYVASGTAVANFSVATTETYTKDGEKKERTEWHNIQAWGRLGEVCAEYLTKGSLVYIEGGIQTQSWEDKDSGEKKYRTLINARTMQILSSKGESSGRPPNDSQADFDIEGDDNDIPF